MPLPLVAIAGMTIARTLATRLGPRAISALKKMDKTKAKNLINKAKNAFKSKDTKRIDNVKNQIDKTKQTLKKEKDIQKKYVEAGNVKKIKNLKSKETKLQKEKNILEKKKAAKKENIKKKVKETVKTGGVLSTIPYILDKKKKEDKPVRTDKKEIKNKELAPPKLSNTITIKKGDTLSEIAKNTPGVTLGAIKKANPNLNLNKISIGQKINMPKEEELSPDRKSVYQDLTKSEMEEIAIKKKVGGPLKNIPAGNKGLPNLPKSVRNKMGFNKRGGRVVKRAVGGGVALRGLGAVRRV
jgi:LysM repeat protein